jgi:hypothetical protein
MKRSTSTKSSSSRDTFENYDPTVPVRSSYGSDPLIPYSPDLVIQAVQQSGLSEYEIAEKANKTFSWQWVYSLEAGDYPRARRWKLTALARTLGIPLQNLAQH